jgi:DNA-binding PadR family transcriptional regulator
MRLYPNLDTLVDKALIDNGSLDERTNFYTVTSRGRREIEARKDWEDLFVDL